jgi:translation initiation factor IF-2
MRASIMLEKGKPEYATILAFDVRIDADARAYAEETGVRIFTADIIYHLFDQVSMLLLWNNSSYCVEVGASSSSCMLAVL